MACATPPTRPEDEPFLPVQASRASTTKRALAGVDREPLDGPLLLKPPPAAPKPGLFAPKGEKELYKAVKAQDIQAIKGVGVYFADFRLLPTASRG